MPLSRMSASCSSVTSLPCSMESAPASMAVRMLDASIACTATFRCWRWASSTAAASSGTMTVRPGGAAAATTGGGPTCLIRPPSISTAAGDSTFPVFGSSSRCALTRVSAAGDGAQSAVDAMRPRIAAETSIFAIAAFHGIEQLLRVVPDPVLEHDLHVLHVGDAGGRIALDHDQVRALSHRDRADLILPAEVGRAVERGDPDRLHRGEAGLDQQLDLPLIA